MQFIFLADRVRGSGLACVQCRLGGDSPEQADRDLLPPRLRWPVYRRGASQPREWLPDLLGRQRVGSHRLGERSSADTIPMTATERLSLCLRKLCVKADGSYSGDHCDLSACLQREQAHCVRRHLHGNLVHHAQSLAAEQIHHRCRLA